MKLTAVKLSVILRHPWQCLNAGTYLGGVGSLERAVAQAERNLRKAQSTFDNARQRLAEARLLEAELVAGGDITPLENDLG